MAPNFPFRYSLSESNSNLSYPGYEEYETAPSLPIILLSSACGLGVGMLGFYLGYSILHFGLSWSAAVATFGLLGGISVMAGALTVASRSRALLSNIGFSCGLIVISMLFLGLCALAGAIVATLVLMLGG